MKTKIPLFFVIIALIILCPLFLGIGYYLGCKNFLFHQFYENNSVGMVTAPPATYQSSGTAGTPTSLCINATIRQGCCCDSADNLTCVLIEGAGTVNNVSFRVVKE